MATSRSRRLRPSRETWNFALTGAAVAVLGHAMLALLIAAGWTAALANVVQAVVTLQINFWANRHLTWRRRLTGSPVRLWRRWGRFHLARGASLLVAVAAFPIVAPRVGPAIAYWRLLAAACVVNFHSDETCLTEDAKIGITASVLGYRVDVVYLDELVTREEAPARLGAFVRQRVRWMQSFMQVFAEGDWLRLPTLTQRVLAVYVLGFQFFQAHQPGRDGEWCDPPRQGLGRRRPPGRLPVASGHCSGSSRPASRTASAVGSTPTCSPRPRRAT